jgi:hypothetical protein
VDLPIRLDPLETVVQKRRDPLGVAFGEGIGQTFVRLPERGRVIGGEYSKSGQSNRSRAKQQAGGKSACEETLHGICLLLLPPVSINCF